MSITLSVPYPLWRFFLVKGFLWDWLVALFLIAFNLTIPINVVKPVERFVTEPVADVVQYFVDGEVAESARLQLSIGGMRKEGDASLSFPEKDSTISSPVLGVLVVGVPVLTFVAWQIVKAECRQPVDLHHGVLSLTEASAMATSFKRWMNLIGRLRPDWFSRVERDSELLNGRLSYPSGHTAYMFMAMTITSLYVIGKLELLSKPKAGQFGLLIISMFPIGAATYVGLTRALDYRHDFSDINAGAIIGIASGTICYLLNFNSVFDQDSAEIRERFERGTGGASRLSEGAGEERRREEAEGGPLRSRQKNSLSAGLSASHPRPCSAVEEAEIVINPAPTSALHERRDLSNAGRPC